MDETQFTLKVTQELEQLADRLEASDAEGLLEIEFLDGILTIKLEDGREYVINKHTPTRKIWASSPISGASYYAFDEKAQEWRATRGADTTVRQMLKTEMLQVAGIAVVW